MSGHTDAVTIRAPCPSCGSLQTWSGTRNDGAGDGTSYVVAEHWCPDLSSSPGLSSGAAS